MRWVYQTAVVVTCLLAAAPSQASDWVQFADETSTRLVAESSLGANDTQEKDYAWGDLDQDGDIDLVVVRKQIGSTTGRRRNVLFMNEGGVLVDRTSQYATEADDGGQGFLDLTNDRDVALVDVNSDGWLDMVTATTYGQSLPKTISHPRIYINKGNDGQGNWLGFRYEEARIPQIVTLSGVPAPPNFCTVAFGDVTGDGYPDLYFGDYDQDINNLPDSLLDDRLLVNQPDNLGFFNDETEARVPSWLAFSGFTSHVIIVDINHDGVNDIVKNSALNPYNFKAAYNDADNMGIFTQANGQIICNCTPYFVSAGDLNNDGLLDLVEPDDGADRYFLNQGNAPDGKVNWISFTFPNSNSGFDNNSVIADLDNDGWNDVLIADVDVDLPSCGQHLDIHHNLGDPPNVTFQYDLGNLPIGPLSGTHDVAVFDINGDNWLDLVIGTCNGTTVWINQPTSSVAFEYPDGLPSTVPPGKPYTILVALQPAGGTLEPGTELIHVSTNRGSFVATPMEPQGRNVYTATLPASACLDTLDFYFSAQISGNGVFTDPINAPADFYSANVAVGMEITFQDEFEDDVSAWQVVNDPSLTSGAWEQADPNGTICCGGLLAAPDNDATPDPGVMAFVTENCQGAQCDNASATDVDGGPTHLISPVFDLDGTDAIISYARWFFTDTGGTTDFFTVAVSNDGGETWIPVPEHTTSSTQGAWESVSFLVGNYVIPTSDVRVRFTTSDSPNDSVTEAGVDSFQVEAFICDGSCQADLNNDGSVGILDLLALLAAWNSDPGGPPDFDGDGNVGILDLLALLAEWGPCP